MATPPTQHYQHLMNTNQPTGKRAVWAHLITEAWISKSTKTAPLPNIKINQIWNQHHRRRYPHSNTTTQWTPISSLKRCKQKHPGRISSLMIHGNQESPKRNDFKDIKINNQRHHHHDQRSTTSKSTRHQIPPTLKEHDKPHRSRNTFRLLGHHHCLSYHLMKLHDRMYLAQPPQYQHQLQAKTEREPRRGYGETYCYGRLGLQAEAEGEGL